MLKKYGRGEAYVDSFLKDYVCMLMSTDFPRIITLLRKEKGLSQKQVANDLKISPSVLSHYEKGIRECKLDFVIKCAQYYKVSCDYLLGCAPDKTGAKLTIDNLPDTGVCGKENTFKGSLLPVLNKRLILNSLNIIFDLLQKIENRSLTNELSVYLMTSIYKAFRIIYSSNQKNPQDMFSIAQESYIGFVGALQGMCESNANYIVSGKNPKGFEKFDKNNSIDLSPNILSSKYPNFAPSLYNIIQNIEHKSPNTKEQRRK